MQKAIRRYYHFSQDSIKLVELQIEPIRDSQTQWEKTLTDLRDSDWYLSELLKRGVVAEVTPIDGPSDQESKKQWEMILQTQLRSILEEIRSLDAPEIQTTGRGLNISNPFYLESRRLEASSFNQQINSLDSTIREIESMLIVSSVQSNGNRVFFDSEDELNSILEREAIRQKQRCQVEEESEKQFQLCKNSNKSFRDFEDFLSVCYDSPALEKDSDEFENRVRVLSSKIVQWASDLATEGFENQIREFEGENEPERVAALLIKAAIDSGQGSVETIVRKVGLPIQNVNILRGGVYDFLRYELRKSIFNSADSPKPSTQVDVNQAKIRLEDDSDPQPEEGTIVAKKRRQSDKRGNSKKSLRALGSDELACIDEYLETNRRGDPQPMAKIVENHVFENPHLSANSIMRALNDHPDKWKYVRRRVNQKTTKRQKDDKS